MTTAREFSRYGGLLSFLLLTAPSLGADTEPPWFISASLGQTSFDTSLDVNQGNIDLLFDPEDEGDSYAVALGYAFDPDWFASVEYSYFDADDTEFQNVYLSLNYRWPLGREGAVFLGVLGGQSTLEWQRPPINTVNRDDESEQLLIGAQAGVSYDLARHWRVMLRYQFLAPEHETKLRPGNARGEITHETFHNLFLDFQFRF